MPAGPGKWSGTNPILPLAGTWKPWVLSSPDEFRPAPPIPYDSPEKAAELAEIKNFQRTPQTNNEALFWEAAVGGLRAHQYWNEQLGKKTLEYRLDDDPPRAARAFVLPFVTLYDAAIACWEAKYTYWGSAPSNSIRRSSRYLRRRTIRVIQPHMPAHRSQSPKCFDTCSRATLRPP